MNEGYNLKDILDGKHPTYQTAKLKKKLIEEGIKTNSCEECGLNGIWNNKPIVMHLDHINGKSDDHRLENLKMLCPNCHSQTETYAGKNKNNKRRIKCEEKRLLRKALTEKEKDKKKKIEEERIKYLLSLDSEYGSVMKAAKDLNISHTHVRRLLKKIGG